MHFFGISTLRCEAQHFTAINNRLQSANSPHETSRKWPCPCSWSYSRLYPFSSSHTSTLPPISLVDQFFVPSALIASIPNYVGPATKSTGMASTTFRIPQPVFQTLTTKFIKTWSSQFRTSSPADPNPSDSSTSHAIALCVCVWKPRFSLLSLLVHFTPISFCREMTMEAFAAVLLLWNLSRLTA